MKRKICSVILIMGLIFSLIPQTAIAAEESTAAAAIAEVTADAEAADETTEAEAAIGEADASEAIVEEAAVAEAATEEIAEAESATGEIAEAEADDEEIAEAEAASNETDAGKAIVEEAAAEESSAEERSADVDPDRRDASEDPLEEPSYEETQEESRNDGSYPITGVQSILTGLNSKGQIPAGKPVTFEYAALMALNADLNEVLLEGGDTVVGIRKTNGETTELTAESGVFSIIAPKSDAFIGYYITVTVVATGAVYESNMSFTVNADPIVTLTLTTEGKGTAEASKYEVQSGEEIKLTITPDDGWYFDKLETVSGGFGYRAGMENTIYLYDSDTVIKVVFKEVVATGNCGDNATYSFDTTTGVMTISGTGEIAEGAFYNDIPHAHEWDPVKSVVIEEGITGIGKEAFYYWTELEAVSFPQSLKTIGEYAFYVNKNKLTAVELPQGLETIGAYAFAQCYVLRNAAIPEGVRTIGDNAFFYTAITEVTVPASVTSFGRDVFNSCKSLVTAVIEADLETLPPLTFYQCKSLKNVSLPESLETLGYDAFYLCTSLENIDLPEGITTFGESVFYQCSALKSITIPQNVTELPSYAFCRCYSLKSVELPDGLTTIKGSAFESCRELLSVEFPEHATVISAYAFRDCKKLAQVTLPPGLTKIPESCFENCPSLASIDLPDSVREIANSAFVNTGLTKIVLPAGLEKIGRSAFSMSDKGQLTGDLTIPAKVTVIDNGAFYNSDFDTITNLSSQSFLVFDLIGNSSVPSAVINVYLNSSGEEVDTIGKGTYTKKATIVPDKVVCPSGKALIYTGKELTGVPLGANYTISGNTGTTIGFYTATVSLADKKKFVWTDGTTEDKKVSWKILPGKTARGDMFNLANNVKVTWKAVYGAKYYKVYRSGVKDPVIVTTGLVGWDKEPGLVNGKKYTYKIVASLTGKGNSNGDSTVSYSKVMYRLKTVVIRSAKNTAPGKVTVKYDKTDSGDSYVLQYCEREDMVGAKTKVVLGAQNTSYVLSGLKKGKTYYISIRVRKKVDGIDYYTTFGVPKKVKITQ